MRKLLRFIYQNRALLLFLLLELGCLLLIVNSHNYQGAQYFNSSNRTAASLLAFSQNTSDYFNLRKANEDLAYENAELKARVQALSSMLSVSADSGIVRPFDFITARIVSNSTAQFRNYITIDKGKIDGIETGMAVTGQAGIVGKIKAVSDRYSVIISLLNTEENVSAEIARTGVFGTVNWDGSNPRFAKLLYLPRHVSVWRGDTVRTSGFNAVFPPRMPVGVVTEANLDESSMFYDVTIELAQDFSRLQYVHVIRSKNEPAIDSVQQMILKK